MITRGHAVSGEATQAVRGGVSSGRVSGAASCLGVLFLTPVLAANAPLGVSIDAHGVYHIARSAGAAATLISAVAAKVDGRWIRTTDYPSCQLSHAPASGDLGAAIDWRVRCSGDPGQADLAYRLRVYAAGPFADLRAEVINSTARPIHVQALRLVVARGDDVAALGAPAAADRILSDSFSEDRPAMRIHDIEQIAGDHARAVGSQLIYNRTSHESLFIGALTSKRFLTVLRLKLTEGARAAIDGYQVDSTGTTELEEDNSLRHSSAQDRVMLSLPVAPGARLASETVLLSVSRHYHQQLQTYGRLIRRIHHARVRAPALMGWWSWTAYYFGLNDGAARTNATWEAQHLAKYGYKVFHIDEGYQFARGDYISPNATLFPQGLNRLEYAIRGLGLTPGIWTAPFEVSRRSWVYRHHPDWLVKNAAGRPIHIGTVLEGKDPLYALDTTNPGAQAYLRRTYRTLVRVWGIHYIKLDFMDDSAIEGYRYRKNTTAMQAQRVGLRIIREAVGNDVYLDKDGSVMLNPVGYVDYGRISQDTGHSFGASRDAATGIAARYYMNRNFFVADPDAFTVSRQRITDQTWHEGKEPLTLPDAEVSISLAAVSGGMLEIGDNLPSLEGSPRRLALIENPDVIDMVKLGQASVPLDLMSYPDADRQPSVFFLRESPRQSVLTVFNWTVHARTQAIRLADLGLPAAARYRLVDVFAPGNAVPRSAQAIELMLPAHSVRMIKIINPSVPKRAPAFAIECPVSARSGVTLECRARSSGADPILSYRWTFGDGVAASGVRVRHTWTEPGRYPVRVTARGLDGERAERTWIESVSGHLSTVFRPSTIRRFGPAR